MESNVGDVYTGEWRDNVACGCGIYRHHGESSTYEGQFHDDLQDGDGVETWAGGDFADQERSKRLFKMIGGVQ